MVTIIDYPCALGYRDLTLPTLQPVLNVGQESIGGFVQVVSGTSKRWRTAITVDIYNPERLRLFKSFMARLNGMAGTIRLKICEPTVPNQLAGSGITYDQGLPFTSHEGDFYFAEGHGWHLDRGYILTLGSLSRGATSLTLDGYNASTALAHLRDGLFITIGDDLHILTAVVQNVLNPTETVLAFEPPLRRNHATGVTLKTSPTGIFRLENLEVPRLDLSLRRFGTIQFNLIEAYERLPQ